MPTTITRPHSSVHRVSARGLRWLVATILLSNACQQSAGRGPHDGKKDKAGKGEEPLLVDVVRLERGSVDRWYRTSGTLTAVHAAQLVPVQAGVVQAIYVEEGDHVRAGDALARLDGRELSLQADKAVMEARNLERELQRLESIASNAVAREEVDKQRYAVETARATARLNRHQFGKTVLRAPFTGTITARHVDVGALASGATPLFDLADLTALELELHLPERDAASVRLDSKVDIELVDGTHFPGKVVRRAPIVDAATGTVKIAISASDYPKTAMPGAFVRAKVLVDSRANVPTVPRAAVFELEGTPHVYVVDERRARRKPVELGLQGDERVEVRAGIADDDVVIKDGNAGITEGMAIKLESDPAATSPIERSDDTKRRPGTRG